MVAIMGVTKKSWLVRRNYSHRQTHGQTRYNSMKSPKKHDSIHHTVHIPKKSHENPTVAMDILERIWPPLKQQRRSKQICWTAIRNYMNHSTFIYNLIYKNYHRHSNRLVSSLKQQISCNNTDQPGREAGISLNIFMSKVICSSEIFNYLNQLYLVYLGWWEQEICS